MSVARIAHRYAKSLIDLAVEQGKLQRVLQDVQSFQAYSKNKDFRALIKSPIVATSKKEAVFESLFKTQYDPLTMSFLQILLRKGREAYLPEIAEEFMVEYKKRMHITTVRLTTAVPLSDTAKQDIQARLIASGKTSEQVDLQTAVDPNLIGGYILEFDGNVYDASIKHKLYQLKDQFDDNLYISQIIAR
jgi:F-type H+-transporting ATPase subunit delta